MSTELSRQENCYYEFGPFRLDVAGGRLLREGREVLLRENGRDERLPPKAYELLLCLVKSGGRVVAREELLEEVWQDAFVVDNRLSDNVSTLRKYLGDSAKSPRFIETVPKRGYRFLADVREVHEEPVAVFEQTRARVVVEEEHETLPAAPDPATSAVAAAALPARAGRPGRRLTAAVFFVVAGLITAALGAYFFMRGRAGDAHAPLAHTVAVLPFKPLVAESRDPALELGMTDALITKLSNIRQITVRPTNSVLKFAAEGQDLRAAGRELDVDVLLDGRVQRAGDHIRLSVQLVRASDGATVWAEKFDEEFKDIFAVQDSISERVASALALRLTGEERRGLAKRYTDNVRAYELYLKGHQHWSTFKQSELLVSINYFNEALKVDPNYALAYTGLANAYHIIGIYGPLPAGEAMPKAREAVEKALALDDDLAQAHTALGGNKILYERDWAGAEREFKRAMELSPNLTDPHSLYGYCLLATGRMDEAVAELRRAKELAPTWFIPNRDYLWTLLVARRYDEAIEQSRQVTRLEPEDYFAHCILGQAHTQQGRFAEAETELQRAIGTVKERPARLRGALGYLYAVTGKRDEAQKIIEQLKGQPESRPLISIAQIYTGLGDRDRAFAALEGAYEERYPMLWHIKVLPEFDSLRADPRYAELLRRINLTP